MTALAFARSQQRYLIALVVLLTAVRVFAAAISGLGDAEAYYWSWSEQLDWGYVDHGPLVAWLIAASTAAFGVHPLTVRLPFIVLSALTLLLVAQIAFDRSRALDPNARALATGLRAAALIALMPMFFIAGGAANPDVPFLFLVALFLRLALGLARPSKDSGRGGQCLLLGAVAGLACLAKFFGVLLAWPLLMVCRRQEPRWRCLSLASIAMFLISLPQLVWNLRRGFPSLRYHFLDRHQEHQVGLSWENLAKLIGGQLAYVSPLVLLALGAALFHLARQARSVTETAARQQARTLLHMTAALGLLPMVLILLVPSAEPHWPAAGYLPLVLVASGALPRWSERPAVRRLSVVAVAFSLLLGLGFYLHALTDLGLRLAPPGYVARYDLSNELYGWPQVAAALDLRLRKLDDGRPTAIAVAGCHYTTCAQLRFAAAGRFSVLCPSPRRDQFDYFPGGDGAARHGIDLLYLRDERFPFSASELYRCATIQSYPPISIQRGGRIVRRFTPELCRRFSGLGALSWPPAPPRRP